MKKLNKWISGLLLLAALSALVFIGAWNLYKKKLENKVVHLKEVPFGLPPDSRVLMGRGYDLKKELKAMDPLVRELVYKAENHWKQGKAGLAITNLEEVLKQNNRAFVAYAKLAEYLQAMPGETEKTGQKKIEEIFVKALEIDPGHPLIRYSYGEFLWKNGSPVTAMHQFELSSDFSPAFPKPYLGMGKIMLEKENYFKAQKHFRTAISLMEGRPDAPYDLLAYTFFRMGWDDSASMVTAFTKKSGRSNPRLEFVEALLLEAEGKISAAEKKYEVLINQFPENRKYQMALATLEKKPPRARLVESGTIGDKKWKEATAAIEILHPLVTRYKENAPLWYALGRAYMKRELFAHAVDCFDSSLKFNPKDELFQKQRSRAMQMLEQRGALKVGDQTSGQKAIFNEPQTEGRDEVILGHYLIHWGAFKEDVYEAYPKTIFEEMRNGNLKEVYYLDRLKFEITLGFKEDKLWGILVFVSDTTRSPGDLFGKIIGKNSQISGKGKATGPSYCTGYKKFQGVIWENEDTFEFLVQFKGKDWQVRLVRVGKEFLSGPQRLCDRLVLMDTDTWN